MVTRILIVRLGALGDIVHAVPAAAALRRAFPAARIDWLVSARHAAILDLVTVVDRRLLVNDRSGASGGMSLPAAIRELRAARYDVAVDLQGLLKSAALARASGAARIAGFAAPYARERFAPLFYTDAYDPGAGGMHDPREARHVVALNLALLSVVGVRSPAVEFPLAHVESEAAETVQRQTAGRYALLNPGAAWPNKRWPPARLAAVAMELAARYQLRSVVLWGPGEESLAAEVVAGAGGTATLSPKTGVTDLVALARGAALMVSGDTGPLHIAAAVGTPIVGIYGPTRPARNGPVSPDDVSVSRDGVCQCHHQRECRLARMCLLDIDVAEVVAAVDRRLSRTAVRVREGQA
jgi:lipopolysaccharide heptosyltransferase I